MWSLIALALAGRALSSVVLESVPDMPLGWKVLDDTVDPEQRLRLSIALRQPDMQELNALFADGKQHLTREEAQLLRTPDKDDVEGIQNWLSEHNITNTKVENDWIHVHTTVGKAEPLLNMEIRRYQFEDKGPALRTQEYSIPDHLSDAISFVHPIANFMSPRKELTSVSPPMDEVSVKASNSPCFNGTTPSCIRELYNITSPDVSNTTSGVRLGVAGFLEEYANYADIHEFLSTNVPKVAGTGYNFSVELVHGGLNPQELQDSGSEAALDMEYAMSLGFPADVTFYSVGGRGVKLNDSGDPLPEEFVDNEPYLELIDHLLDKSDDELPHILSVSYADDELSVPRQYAERVCSFLGLLTARGTSILGGSGDGGQSGGHGSTCKTYDGRNKTMSVFPSTCPWVTAVGATKSNADPDEPEGASFSGGGFSQYFTRPKWQDEAVEGYVAALNGTLDGYYNASMRALPDISTIGTRFETLFKGRVTPLDGTSASTPLLAAMIAQINAARFAKGKPSIGWLNKHLYSSEVEAVLKDVTLGTSRPCNFGDASAGWPATKGWDAITGVGVPDDFQKLVEVLVAV